MWTSFRLPISPGNGLCETFIPLILRKTSPINAYIAFILAQTFFETVNFVITIQKASSYSPVFVLSLMQLQQIQPNQVHPHPSRKSSLWDVPTLLIHRFYPSCIRLYISPIGRTSLRDVHFCDNYTKMHLKTTCLCSHFCLFITNQFSNYPSQRRYPHYQT